MFPELLRIGSFSLPTYGVLVATGMVLGLFLTSKLAQREGIDPEKVWNLGIYIVLAGILGAKLLMIVNEGWTLRQFFSLAMLQAGGSFSGGVVLAFLVAGWYIRKHHLPPLRTMDVFAPGLAIGHAIGRLGCFAAGCCWGRETSVPWGVVFTNPLANQLVGTPLGIHIHPTQIYEAIAEALIFCLLLWLAGRRRFDGQLIGTWLFLYGFARFFIEMLRADERGHFFGLAMSNTQFLAILMVIGGGVLWMRGMSRQAVTAPSVSRS